ncbi:MAG: outer membrane beta-barrel protein [Bacteroidota bacterium]
MKKLVFFGALIFALQSSSAQGIVKVGVTGGLLNTNADISLSALGISLANIDAVNKTGFYIGGVLDVAASEKFHIQPELTYGSAGDLSFIYFPIMAKYYIIPMLNIQVGPQLNFSSNLDDIKDTIDDIQGVVGSNGDLDDVLKSTTIDLAFGAGFDITNSLSAQVRYAIALTDRYDGPLGGSLDIKNATLNIGIAYFFN